MIAYTQEPLRSALLSFASLAAGMLFYALYHKVIIIRLPHQGGSLPAAHRYARRQRIRLWGFNGERFISDDKELIYSANTQQTIHDLVSSWLSFHEEEQLLPKKIAVQSVLVDIHATTAYISFSESPFTGQEGAYVKSMLMESLARTLKESGLEVHKFVILENHQLLHDPHLDMRKGWSVAGYL